MTKKTRNLHWQLSEKPSGHVVAELVANKVISTEEAREILFGSAQNDKELIKAQAEQIEFLRNLVTELSKQRQSSAITYTYPREIRYYNTPYWMETNKFLAKNGLDLSTKGSGAIDTSKISELTTESGQVSGGITRTAGYVNADLTSYSGNTGGVMLSVSSNSNIVS